MPLKTAMQRRSGQVRQGRLQCIEAVIQWQQCVSTEGHDECIFLQRQDRRVALLWPHGGIMHVGAFLSLCYRLRVYIVALGQLRYAFLTMLDRATHCRCRAGAPV